VSKIQRYSIYNGDIVNHHLIKVKDQALADGEKVQWGVWICEDEGGRFEGSENEYLYLNEQGRIGIEQGGCVTWSLCKTGIYAIHNAIDTYLNGPQKTEGVELLEALEKVAELEEKLRKTKNNEVELTIAREKLADLRRKLKEILYMY